AEGECPTTPTTPTTPISPASLSGSAGPDTTYLLREIQAVSRILRHPDDIQAVRAHAVAPAESMSTHE
ncbi:hypothetical protein ACFWBB_22835, partial [Streptomyces sp. NPDC060000]